MEVKFPENADEVSRQRAKDYQRKAKLIQAQADKDRTHRLCTLGGHIESVFEMHGWTIEISKAVIDALKGRDIYGNFSDELQKIKEEVCKAAEEAKEAKKLRVSSSIDASTTSPPITSASTTSSAYDSYRSESTSTPTSSYDSSSYTSKTGGTY